MKSSWVDPRSSLRGLACVLLGVVACAARGVDLPAPAVPVEYVQGNGTDAYMDTGWTVNPATDMIQIEFAVTDERANETIWCARGASLTDRAFAVFAMGGEGNVRFDYKSGSTRFSNGSPLKAGVKYKLTAAGGSIALDNGMRHDFSTDLNFTATGSPLQLFCAYLTTDYKRSSFGTWRLYALRYWRSGELIHDCIPFRSADGKDAGLWDRIDGKGVTRSGSFITGPDAVSGVTVRLPDPETTATVVRPSLEVRNADGRLLTPGEDYAVEHLAGPRVGEMRARVTCLHGSGASGVTNLAYTVRRPVPAAYERLSYIQGDGRSWMLTDYVPNPQTDVLSLDFSLSTVETTAFLCARDNSAGRTWSFCIIGTKYRFDYMSAGTQLLPASAIRTDATYTVTLSNNVATVSCGHTATATANAGFTSTVNPLMFYAFYSNGPGGSRATLSKHKTYVCRAWRSGTLIHEWVPVRRVADGVATLYDTVTGKAETPRYESGTPGAFIAGPALPAAMPAVTVAGIPKQTLAGAACTPALDVRDAADGHALVAGTDYTAAYADNTVVGGATATVTGLGAYAGLSLAVPFQIVHPLPAGAERLAYIQGDGKTRLVTDWTVRPAEDRLDAELAFTQEKINAGVWCSRGATHTTRTFTFFQLAAGTFRWDYADAVAATRTFTQGAGIRTGVRYAVRATNRGELSIGDRAVAAHPRATVFSEAGGPLMLFASYYDGAENNVDFYSTHRQYGLSVRRGGVLARSWVPVRTASGAATLFEEVTGATLTPLGTGAFIAGPKPADFDLYVRDQAWDGAKRVRPQVVATNRVTGAALAYGADFVPATTADTASGSGVVTATGAEGSAYAGQFADAAFEIHAALPEGYTRLRHVQGDGRSYLSTGLVPRPTTDRVVLDFELPDDGMTSLFCARASWADRAWGLCVVPSPARFRFDYATSNMNEMAFGPILRDRRYVADVNGRTCTMSSGESFTVKGKDTVPEAGGPLMLLCYYSMVNGQPNPGTISRARIRGCRMYRSGELIHDWVPVLTPEGVATLYDLVDQAALVPAGGALIAGPAIEYDPPAPAGTLIMVR